MKTLAVFKVNVYIQDHPDDIKMSWQGKAKNDADAVIRAVFALGLVDHTDIESLQVGELHNDPKEGFAGKPKLI